MVAWVLTSETSGIRLKEGAHGAFAENIIDIQKS